MDVHDYCEAQVAPPGSSLRYSLMTLALPERRALIALHALQQELEATAAAADPVVARVRLDWWREELARSAGGRAQHPVAQALTGPIERYRLDTAGLLELAAAAEMELDYDLYPGFAQLLVYCHRAGSSLTLLKARVLGYRDPGTEAFARELGVMLMLARRLVEVRTDARAGRCFIPEDELNRFGMTPGDLLQDRTTGPLAALFRFQLGRIREYHDRALERLPAVDRSRQRNQLALAELTLALLAEIEADGLRLLEHRLGLTPLTRFWLAWRSLRRARKRGRMPSAVRIG